MKHWICALLVMAKDIMLKKKLVACILAMPVAKLANTTETKMNALDQFNEAFYRNAAPVAAGFLIGFVVCLLRFVW